VVQRHYISERHVGLKFKTTWVYGNSPWVHGNSQDIKTAKCTTHLTNEVNQSYHIDIQVKMYSYITFLNIPVIDCFMSNHMMQCGCTTYHIQYLVVIHLSFLFKQ